MTLSAPVGRRPSGPTSAVVGSPSPTALRRSAPSAPPLRGKETRRSARRDRATITRLGALAKPDGPVASSLSSRGAPPAERLYPLRVPEDLEAASGEVLVHNKSYPPPHPADVFRCVGCRDPACAGPQGCALPMRGDRPGAVPSVSADGGGAPSTAGQQASFGALSSPQTPQRPGASVDANGVSPYVRAILTSSVYDVAVETPLTRAPRLSDATGVEFLLKREDAQPVKSFKLRRAGRAGRRAGREERDRTGPRRHPLAPPSPTLPPAYLRPSHPVSMFFPSLHLCSGAHNKIAQLTAEELSRGVCCASAGNHAQGVSLSAAWARAEGAGRDLPPPGPDDPKAALICMPTTTPDIKISSVRRLGGEVALHGDTYSDTSGYAERRAIAEGRVFVHPYDDPWVVAGQGTVGVEILRQCVRPKTLTAVFCAIGGGGLAAGVAAYLKSMRPDVLVFGVEPCGSNAMAQSLKEGRRVEMKRVDGFADGVAVKLVGAETFRLCREHLDGTVLVSNAEISAAIRDVFDDTRSILEPAGAVAVAGAKAWIRREAAEGRPLPADASVVAIASGANINFDRLRLVSDLANGGARTEALFASRIPERPGALRAFVEAGFHRSRSSDDGNTSSWNSIGGSGNVGPPRPDVAVTEFKYRLHKMGADAVVMFSVGLDGPGEARALAERCTRAGFPTRDLSGNEDAAVHLRHLVGGRASGAPGPGASASGSIDETVDDAADDSAGPGAASPLPPSPALPDERFFVVQFPEKPGALRAFLYATRAFNLTAFHYRYAGGSTTQALVGFEVPSCQGAEWDAAMDLLGRDEASAVVVEGVDVGGAAGTGAAAADADAYGYAVREIGGETRALFEEFL